VDISRTVRYTLSSLTSFTISRYRFSHKKNKNERKPIHTSLMLAAVRLPAYIIIPIVISILKQGETFICCLSLFQFFVYITMLFTVEWLIQGYKCERKYPPHPRKIPPTSTIRPWIFVRLWRRRKILKSTSKYSHESEATRKNQQWRTIWNEQDAEYEWGGDKASKFLKSNLIFTSFCFDD
jgi:hypothetical protein